ncbi:MAG: hypothetical protein PVJ49_17635 [Acidobacteriota bacterium]|jgi:hypothetical protein
MERAREGIFVDHFATDNTAAAGCAAHPRSPLAAAVTERDA